MSANPFTDPTIHDAAFAESEHFLAIYNIAPILPGHSLVIPKREVQSFQSLTDAEVVEMVLFSRHVLKILDAVFGTAHFNWTIQEGDLAGQTVPHLHLHIIPRTEGDLKAPGDWYPELEKTYTGKGVDSTERPRLSPEELRLIAKKIMEAAEARGLETQLVIKPRINTDFHH